jgi:hypothetical protein
LAPGDARTTSRRLLETLRTQAPDLLSLDGVDLGPALEQQLFFALRDGSGGPAGPAQAARDAAIAAMRAVGAVLNALIPRRAVDVPPGPVVVLIRLPARMTILRPIEAELERRGGGPLVIVRVGRAAANSAGGAAAPRMQDVIGPGAGLAALRYQARVMRGLGRATGGWVSIVDRPAASRLAALAERELPRIALGAAAVTSIVSRWQPSLVVGFDEVGTWSRIVPAVARHAGIPSLNLPHAEADDPVAIAGADYDRFAVFGPRAARVFAAAGIPADRVVETGAPHFDGLILRGVTAPGPGALRRILFAAQYVQGVMTLAGLEACHRCALAAAAAVEPAEVLVLPHPVQPAGQIQAIVARAPVPAGVAVRVERPGRLHELVEGAWLLVTGWSNSLFEAAIRGVPTVMVDAEHVLPVTYAQEGLAIRVATESAAAAAARALLDPEFRTATLARSSAALAEHLGPLDGRSSERTAELILTLADRAP